MNQMTGRLLVATPALEDPNFSRSVVLVLDDDEDGSLGVVLNRPTTVAVGEILPPWADLATSPHVLFHGGPVALDSALGIAVVTGEGEPLGWRQVHGRLGLVDLDAPPEILAAQMQHLRIFAGYAGWSSGQLAEEVAEGAWYLLDARTRDPFSGEPESLWREVLRRQGGDLALVATYPEDPTLN